MEYIKRQRLANKIVSTGALVDGMTELLARMHTMLYSANLEELTVSEGFREMDKKLNEFRKGIVSDLAELRTIEDILLRLTKKEGQNDEF